jgi:LPS export ABC transporter protein LptC
MAKAQRSYAYLLAALIFPTGRPDIEIKRFQLVDVHKQKRRMELKAEQASLYQKLNLSSLRMPETLLFSHHAVPYKILANEGVVHTQTQDLSLRNNCSLLSPDGTLFQTESLDYDNLNGLLTSADAVRAQRNAGQGDDVEISGHGLKIEIKKDTYQILSQVRAQRKNRQKQDLRILSERVSIQPSQSVATFFGNVRVYSDKMELVGSSLKTFFDKDKQKKKSAKSGDIEKLELLNDAAVPGSKIVAKLEKIDLYSNGMEVFFDEKGEVEKMEATGKVDAITRDQIKMRSEKLIYSTRNQDRLILQGNVYIETKDRVAECEEAEFDPQSGQIILKRVATVKKDRQILKGERIRFSTKDSEVFVDQASGELQKQSLGF